MQIHAGLVPNSKTVCKPKGVADAVCDTAWRLHQRDRVGSPTEAHSKHFEVRLKTHWIEQQELKHHSLACCWIPPQVLKTKLYFKPWNSVHHAL